MALLLLFAFVAGAGTAITPCVLPVLPALLSAAGTGGRRRPLGIVLGLTAAFTVTIAVLASVVDGVGLADGAVRTFAVLVLLGFGLSLLIPALGDRIEAPLSRLARLGPRSRGDGFRSGLAVGAALGFVYAPCAGPILGAVISVGATQGASVKVLAVALAYGCGSGVVLLALAYGGRRVADRIRRAGRGPGLQRALGIVLVATAVAMLTHLDVRFQTALASDFPDAVVNPTRALERSHSVERQLADLRGRPHFRPQASGLPRLGAAPDFVGTQRWFNTPGGRPLSLASLRGRVVLVDFWTYTCINCIRTLPYVKAWDVRYRRAGLTIVGVHTPEFSFEHDAANVARAVRENGIRYPVAQDNRYATWSAWGNQYWPADYLIDARGQVRSAHFGEGDYGKTEREIRALLAERGDRSLGGETRVRAIGPSNAPLTPETYLGTARAQRFLPHRSRVGVTAYRGFAGPLPDSHFALRGTWRVTPEAATARRGAGLDATVIARRVYLVLSSAGGVPRRVRVALDGHPAGAVTVRAQQLYQLVSLPRVERRRLTLALPPGVSAYAFTFG